MGLTKTDCVWNTDIRPFSACASGLFECGDDCPFYEKKTVNPETKYVFNIEYYYSLYHTGGLNRDLTRKAIVIAANKNEALEKVKSVDSEYQACAELQFKEIEGDVK